MKTAKDYLDEANAVITRLPTAEAIKRHGADDGIWIDVRDSGDIAKTGTIAGAKRVPRGFMEFAADLNSPYHKDFMQPGNKYYLVCGAGGQAALVGKTLKEMGYTDVTNVGGVPDWKAAGGPTEDA